MIKKKEKKITNTELLESINRSFSKLEAKMATKEDLKGMATKEDLKKLQDKLVFRIDGLEKRMDDYTFNKVGYDNFNPLVKRVEQLEKA